MELMSNNSLKSQLIEEDPNYSLAFRRRNNAIISIFLGIIIILALMVATSFFYNIHSISDSDQHHPLSPAVRAYYSVASNIPSSLYMFMEIVSIKSDADPNLIFTLSLRAAAKDQDITLTEFILPNSGTEPAAYKNCSASLLRDGSVQIRHALEAMRVNPSAGTLSGEILMKWIVAAEGNLNSCIDELRKSESTAVSDVREKLVIVKAYVRSGEEFLLRHDVVMRRFSGETVAGPDYLRRQEVLENLVILCLSGLYMFFLLCILRAICRSVGLKIPPLGNVFRAFFTGAIWRR